MTTRDNFYDRFPGFEPLTVDELRLRGREASRVWEPGAAEDPTHERVRVDLTVDRMRLAPPEERLAKLRVLLDSSTPGRWGTAIVSGDGPPMPIVGHTIQPPICRFDWRGNPGQAFANMRFIVAAHENMAFLLDRIDDFQKQLAEASR